MRYVHFTDGYGAVVEQWVFPTYNISIGKEDFGIFLQLDSFGLYGSPCIIFIIFLSLEKKLKIHCSHYQSPCNHCIKINGIVYIKKKTSQPSYFFIAFFHFFHYKVQAYGLAKKLLQSTGD